MLRTKEMLMRHYAKRELPDKKKLLREQDHLTRPPRLEAESKNAKMNPERKPKTVRKGGAAA